MLTKTILETVFSSLSYSTLFSCLISDYFCFKNIADNKLGARGAELIGLMMSTNATIESLNVARK